MRKDAGNADGCIPVVHKLQGVISGFNVQATAIARCESEDR